MKSQMWLVDPRPNLPSIVQAVEKSFELSEASNTPVMLELRIRACHVYGSFTARDNARPAFTLRDALDHPRRDANRIVLPPASYLHEREKVEKRWPAAVRFIEQHQLNEFFDGDAGDIGIVMQGGMYNTALRALEVLGLADVFGASRIPLYVLNVTYPLIDAEFARFCVGKKAILIIEEGQPEFIEQAVNTILRRADIQTRVEGKGMLPMAGEYTGGVMKAGLRKFVAAYRPDLLPDARAPAAAAPDDRLAKAQQAVAGKVHGRPPSFCTGCPERPIFAAMKLVERELGAHHVSCDIGCHLFSILPPFNLGNTTMGYGLGGAGAAALSAAGGKRAIALVGDGGFWHNGLASSVGNAVFNKSDNVLIVVDNGYSAATGGQDVLSSAASNSMRSTRNPIEKAVRGVGVTWVRTLTRTYDVAKMRDTLREALTTAVKGPKVIIAQSECMLNKQRRVRPLLRKRLEGGKRVVRERFGVDPDTCTGDHSCIRLSGCPSLTLAPNPDPLRREPVTKVINSCVGCGLCGEVAHAAVLCPSFYRASIIANPTQWDRLKHKVRGAVIGWLQRRLDARQELVASEVFAAANRTVSPDGAGAAA
jgi:indolepyruvate ferredoxin oxidoreductase alpha subunit